MIYYCSKNTSKGVGRLLTMAIFIVGCLAGWQSSVAMDTDEENPLLANGLPYYNGQPRGVNVPMGEYVASDQGNPPNPHPKLLHHLLLNYDEDKHQSALLFYSILSQQAATWANATLFMYNADRKFFKLPQSQTIQNAGILSGVVGCLASPTAAGGIMWAVADALGIPPGSVGAAFVGVGMMVTMAPMFIWQYYEMGQDAARYVTEGPQFSPSDKLDDEPHVYKPSALHKALMGLVGVSAALDGAFIWATIVLAEREVYQYITLGMGCTTALAFAARSCSVGLDALSRSFRGAYSSELTNIRRRILIEKIKTSSNHIRKYDLFVERIYQTVQEEMKNNSYNLGSQHYFALSALFLRPGFRDANVKYDSREDGYRPPQGLESHGDNQEALLRALEESQNSNVLINELKSPEKENFMEGLSIFLTGAGSIARLYGRQYAFQGILENIFSFTPGAASSLGWCLSAFNVTMKTLQEYDLQKNYMKSWLNTFSLGHLVDFPWLRKSVGTVALFDGIMFAAAMSWPALAKFREMSMDEASVGEMSIPLSLQVLAVLPLLVTELGPAYTWVNDTLNRLITAITTRHENITDSALPEPDIDCKRAWCHQKVKECERLLETANGETINQLFSLIQRAS